MMSMSNAVGSLSTSKLNVTPSRLIGELFALAAKAFFAKVENCTVEDGGGEFTPLVLPLS